MSPELFKALRKAGGREGRRAIRKARKIVANLERAGYVVHPVARDAIIEFAGLSIGSDGMGEVAFEEEPQGKPERQNIAGLEKREGPLTPIAVIYNGPMFFVVLMSKEGRIFTYNDAPMNDPVYDCAIWGPWPSLTAAMEEFIFRGGIGPDCLISP